MCFAGLTVSDATIASSGLLHTIRLLHFHQVTLFKSTHLCWLSNSSLSISNFPTHLQVYQAFRITVASQCKAPKGTSVYGCSQSKTPEITVVVVCPQKDFPTCTS